jgi:hypothetical protein
MYNQQAERNRKLKEIKWEEFMDVDVSPNIISDKIVEGDADRTCGRHGEEKYVQRFGGKP